MNAGRIEVGFDVLAELLRFPRGTRVLRVSDSDNPGSRTFTVVVEHDSLPVLREGDQYPKVDYTVTREQIEGTWQPF